jgi:glutamate synthase (NADPH/NADH) small chain
MKRVEMKERVPLERAKDFNPVTMGYTQEEAVREASRCIQCKKPLCVEGCPVGIRIPEFIKKLSEEDFAGAVRVLKDTNDLPAICGRVCPQETQCEARCILGKKGQPVAIGDLERFVGDWAIDAGMSAGETVLEDIRSKGRKAAVIGSGPAGLTCAGNLVKAGMDVTVFESLHLFGGVLRYGIPEFRLPGRIIESELRYLKALGINFVSNVMVGRTLTIDEIMKEYGLIFIGTGAGLPNFLGVPGENFNHIYSANEFLVRLNMMHAFDFPEYDTPIYIGKKVVVVGGGNTAMDAARSALRLGAEEVTLVYRRSENEMLARRVEALHAREEGVKFMLLTQPVEFLGNEKGFVRAMECVKMELCRPDDGGRCSVKPVAGSNFIIPVDMVIVAVGLLPNPVVPSLTPALKTDGHGYLVVDDDLMTSVPGIFAGGGYRRRRHRYRSHGHGQKSGALNAQVRGR